MIQVSSSLLSANLADLQGEICKIEQAGSDFLHIDAMDGHYVPNIAFGPSMVESIHKVTKLPLDVHLMLAKPDCFIKKYAMSGASIITIHLFEHDYTLKCLREIKNYGVKTGLAINPGENIDQISDQIFKELDVLLIMGVYPGFSGQKWMDQQNVSIQKAKSLIVDKNLPIKIAVDGGVNLANARQLKTLGADILIAGSAIFSAESYQAAINRLKEG